MKLSRFRVQSFRSIQDSGWIDIDNVTALIGTNESGKTNLLLPLWKLNPANDGQINLLTDCPRNKYNEIRDSKNKPIFITAEFLLPENLQDAITSITKSSNKDFFKKVEISKNFDEIISINFPEECLETAIPATKLQKTLTDGQNQINDSLNKAKKDDLTKNNVLDSLNQILDQIKTLETVSQSQLSGFVQTLKNIDLSTVSKTSPLPALMESLLEDLNILLTSISLSSASKEPDVQELIKENLPSFVYYSHYGNLDSEIYLPHVIENLQRDDLGQKEEAKTRTLKVLFDFVKVSPDEILDLGKEELTAKQPTQEEIQQTAENKKERSVLLQSASTSLTKKFKDWWKQGEYRFRFEADGNHFRIWVSDTKRPEEIELEGRSTGLQWFLSFYLVFLVESQQAHKNSILLLDEPGLSLHPLAQQDLSKFFDNLADTNQLLYTTHSPFLVDPDKLDRVKAVYINEEGLTSVSSDLRAAENKDAQSKSIYPVYAALGLSINITLLQGCIPVIVEGPSDQIYFSFIKNFLISQQLIAPAKELIFLPAGGVKGIKAICSIVSAPEASLPWVVLDGDSPGKQLKKDLQNGLYQGENSNKILLASDFTKIENSEIEDLLPSKIVVREISRKLRGTQTQDFEDEYEDGEALVPQINSYASKHGIEQEKGWKVELAKLVKKKFIETSDDLKMDQKLKDEWAKLFQKFHSSP